MKKIRALLFCFVILLQSFVFFGMAQASDEVCLPILMYHSILNNSQGTYIVSQSQLEQDIIALKNAGFTPVFPSQVIDFVVSNGNLPKKPILITFDDGYYNNLHYGLPLLKKHNIKANINIIGKIVDEESSSKEKSNPNFSYLNWEQIRQLQNSGLVEIGHHSYDMHSYSPRYGISQLWNESESEYKTNLEKDTEKLQLKLKENSLSFTDVFAYPFGEYNNLSTQILKNMDFKMLLTCTEKTNIIKRNNPSCLLNLGRFNRRGDYSTQEILEKISK